MVQHDLVQMREQLFFAIVNDNLLLTNSRESVESLIEECSSQTGHISTDVNKNVLYNLRFNLSAIQRPDQAIRKLSDVGNELRIETVYDKSFIQCRVILPLSILKMFCAVYGLDGLI